MTSGTCKLCGAAITWRRTRRGRWQPLNLDGSLHFPTCRKAVAVGRLRVQAWYRELEAERR